MAAAVRDGAGAEVAASGAEAVPERIRDDEVPLENPASASAAAEAGIRRVPRRHGRRRHGPPAGFHPGRRRTISPSANYNLLARGRRPADNGIVGLGVRAIVIDAGTAATNWGPSAPVDCGKRT